MSYQSVPQKTASLPDLGCVGSLSSRNRRMSSPGGHRSWSEEEESYLLRTRAQKMPYKHIAAHLKKTELACRLHLHQLLHGTRRRKRAASVSSSTSHGSGATYSSGSSPSSHSQYMYDTDADDAFSYGVLCHGTGDSTPLYPSPQKVLLPKPSATTLPLPHHAPRVDLSAQLHGATNTDRLRTTYDHLLHQHHHRPVSWSTMPNDYATDSNPGHLDALWPAHTTMMLPPRQPPPPPPLHDARPLPQPSLEQYAYNPTTTAPPFTTYLGCGTATSTATASTVCLAPTTTTTTVAAMHSTPSYAPHVAAATAAAAGEHVGYVRGGGLGGHDAWGRRAASAAGAGAGAPTSISSLLTENKCPRAAAAACADVGGGRDRY